MVRNWNEEPIECAWCGAEIGKDEKVYPNKRGEYFCSKTHRDSSNRALRRLIQNEKRIS